MTGQESSANPFEFWKDMAQKWSESFGQANPASGPSTGPSMFNPFQQFQNANPFQQFQNFNPFQQFQNANPFQQFQNPNPSQGYNPALVWFQLCQQYMKSWSEFWTQAGPGGVTEETFRAAERQWMQQLEQTAEALSKSMATEAFSEVLGKFIEQGLTWQEKIAAQVNPQIEATYREMNLPSRAQMDRMFERVIGIEERLDDLEEARASLKRLEQRLDELEKLGQEVLKKVTGA